MNDILIIAGERSGDLHGAGLVRELLKLEPGLSFFGIGGPRMREAGVETEFDISQMAIIGFLEVVKRLPFIRNAIRRIETLIDDRKPSLVILIDYPGFNLKIAKIAHDKGIRVLYYISPQVWAWGEKRIPKIAQLVDHMAVILEFERELYRNHNVSVTFVGHPLLEVIHISLSREEFLQKYDLDGKAPILALFPGSREQEIHRLLPEMMKSAQYFVRMNPGSQVALSVSENLPLEIYDKCPSGIPARMVRDTYELMKYSTVMMVASGTATLESAIIGTPFVLVYRVSPLNYMVAKRLVKVKNICLANIVAGREVVPEFVQRDFNPKRVADMLHKFLHDSGSREELLEGFDDIRRKLGTAGANARVAELAVSLMKDHAEKAL
jgi:lipid-A-disaccharide synthase